MKHIFPKWFFHESKMPEGKIIESEEAFKKLGSGWVESPTMFGEKAQDEKPIDVKETQPEVAEKQIEASEESKASEEKTDSFEKSGQSDFPVIKRRSRSGSK